MKKKTMKKKKLKTFTGFSILLFGIACSSVGIHFASSFSLEFTSFLFISGCFIFAYGVVFIAKIGNNHGNNTDHSSC